MLPKSTSGAYLLDLGDVPADQFPARFGAGLASYVDDANRVRLVVTMTTDSWERCGDGGGDVQVVLSPPSATEVVRSHLRRNGNDRTSWVEHPNVRALLTSRTLPRDAVRLAAAIRHAPEQPDALDDDDHEKAPGQPSDAAVAIVVDEYRAWRGFLRGFFGDETTSVVDRALLIAAALLQGAEPVVIWRAAMQLLRGYEVPDQAGDLLAGEDLDTQLARIIGADASALEGGVSLDAVRHGLSAAVLPHVWQQRPQMKDVLVKWIRKVSAEGGAGHTELPTIGRRLAQLAVAVAEFDPVDTVRSWLDDTHDRQVLVAQLLTDIAEQDDAQAAAVRAKTWTWAYAYGKGPGASTTTAELTARICASSFMRRYPNACLVRFKWLLAGPDSLVIDDSARDVLRGMAADDDVEGVLHAAREWRRDSRRAAARAFLSLIDPQGAAGSFRVLAVRAGEDDRLASVLREEWAEAAAEPGLHVQVVAVLRRWVETALEDPALEEPIMGILAWLFRRMSRGSLTEAVFSLDAEEGGLSPAIAQRAMFAMWRRYTA